MILYFSGTGNSRWCAKALEKSLNDTCLDLFADMKKGKPVTFSSEKPWVIVAPTYAWRLPRILSDFLKGCRFEGSSQIYFVMTCGSEIGNAGEENKKLCAALGLEYCGTLQVRMPENYIALFDVPQAEEIPPMMKTARAVLQEGAEQIMRGKAFQTRKTGVVDRLKTGPVNPAFYALVVKAKAFYAKDSCIGCGKCAKGCVLGNIRITEGKPRWGDRCTHCMACICGCPVEAIEYGKSSRGKTRYRCAEFSEE